MIYTRSLQFSSVHLSIDRLGSRGDMRDDSAETPFQSFLQAFVSSSGTGWDAHSDVGLRTLTSKRISM